MYECAETMAMRPSLRLALLLVVVLSAGCLGGPIGATGNETATTAPTTTCSETGVTPAPYPELPTNVTNESAREFSAAYERANLYDDILPRYSPNHVNLHVEVLSQESLDDGWRLTTRLEARHGGCGYSAMEDERAAYFINETAAYRSSDPAVDPRQSGVRIVNGTRSQ